jgi:hypothetical protein
MLGSLGSDKTSINWLLRHIIKANFVNVSILKHEVITRKVNEIWQCTYNRAVTETFTKVALIGLKINSEIINQMQPNTERGIK